MLRLVASLAALVITACSNGSPESNVKGEVSTDNLWAGKVTATIERSVSDPCGNPIDMNAGDLRYGGWARQRAAYTNLCFEVWMPGMTDQDNPDFWRHLDVQVHYRYQGQGSFKTQYVSSIDRRGNNRRYVWNLRNADPFQVSTVPAGIPYTVLSRFTGSDGREWASAESLMEVYFTVNGKTLNKTDSWSFFVKYGDATILLSE